MTPERRAKIRARREAATKGPWVATNHPYDGVWDPRIVSTVIKDAEDDEPVYVAQTVYDMQSDTQIHYVDGDTEFIAHSWQDIGDLLDALDAKDAEIADLRERLNRMY